MCFPRLLQASWFPMRPIRKSFITGSHMYPPTQAKRTWILFCLLVSEGASDDYSKSIEIVQQEAERGKVWADAYGFINLTPWYPVVKLTGNLYYYPRQRISHRWSERFLTEADLKVNLMIDKLIQMLRADDIRSWQSIYWRTFCGGSFAQSIASSILSAYRRFCGGTGGFVTLPVRTYDGTDISGRWAWTIRSLVGYSFDWDTYKKAPQFIYMGELETDR